jgi:hypothetical protein
MAAIKKTLVYPFRISSSTSPGNLRSDFLSVTQEGELGQRSIEWQLFLKKLLSFRLETIGAQAQAPATLLQYTVYLGRRVS